MRLFLIFTVLVFQSVFCFVQAESEQLRAVNAKFIEHYHQQLGQADTCMERNVNLTKACSAVLRNEGNAPYILHHNDMSEWVVVLFHGLSDSPFYLRAVAENLHKQGITVVVGLLPGHGLIDADADMQDSTLSERWQDEVDAVIEITRPLGRRLMVGGFSTGGALATLYTLEHTNDVEGLILISGALALSENAERMSRIWGVQHVTRWVDGDYQTHNRNPYKYPGVALYAVIELMEVINQIREIIKTNPLATPTFAVHSMSDVSTPYRGIEALTSENKAAHSLFLIDESYEVCHGNVPLTEGQVKDINILVSEDEIVERCSLPEANPLFPQMMAMMTNFIQQQ